MAKRIKMGDRSVGVGYLRVSTTEQHLGTDAQRRAIESWAERNGVRVVAWHEDHGVSGAAPIADRPGLLAALHALREHGAGVLVVGKRDRAARDLAVGAAIDSAVSLAGARLCSADGSNGDDDSDALKRDLDAVLASHERRLIRSRTRAALAVKRSRGERVGSIPFGFACGADGVHLVPVEAEQTTIATARELAHGRSLRAVASELAARGMLSRTGRPFAASQISRMVAP